MRAELQIVWDGDGPGLTEHRLSVAALGAPLALLLAAIRRIATNLVTEAADSERGARGGRFARLAKEIDLQVATVEQGCLRLSADVVFPDPSDQDAQLGLFRDELPVRTLKELVEAIDDESKGRPRSVAVRKFLRSTDGLVSSHSYRASVDGRVLAEARVGEPDLLAEPTPASYLVAYEGRVSGVLFEPKPEIRVRCEGQSFRVRATLEKVERALELRGQDVTVYAARSEAGLARLVHIKPSSEPGVVPAPDERQEHVLKRWGPLLERLAQ